MSHEISSNGLRKFCFVLFGAVALVGFILYMTFGETLIGGLGFASSIVSIVSFLHFYKWKVKSKNIESKLTLLLISTCIGGFAIIFINKYRGGSPFIYGLGGGVALMAAISYVLDLLDNFKSNIR